MIFERDKNRLLYFWAVQFLLLWGLHSLFVSCANQVPINGGPRDEKPPELLSSIPVDQTTDYTSGTIELVFDEYVEATNLKKELLITPITEVDYEVKVKKNVVSITFDSLLEENTTYTLNFRKGIVDITERNAPNNLRIAFSTGPEIDSLELSGEVRDALTTETVEKVSIILFRESDSLTVNGGKPLYLVNTGSDGRFSIPNLRATNYRVIALLEEDGDLTYNKPKEKISFLESPVTLDSNRYDLSFRLMEYDNLPFELKRARANKQYVDFTFNKPPKSYELTITDPAQAQNILPVQKGDILRLYQKNKTATDSFLVNIQAEDLLGQKIDSTLEIAFLETRRELEEAFKIESSNPKSKSAILKTDSLRLEVVFSKPVGSYLSDSVFLYTQTDTVNYSVTPKDSLSQTVWIFQDTLPSLPFNLQFRKGAFISVEGDTLSEQSLSYVRRNSEDYGVITGTVNLPQTSFILELLNSKGEVEQKVENVKEFKMNWVEPGNKKLRILIDENGNGVWDKGNFEARELPESVYYYSKPISVKANWEIGLDPITEESLTAPTASPDSGGGVGTEEEE